MPSRPWPQDVNGDEIESAELLNQLSSMRPNNGDPVDRIRSATRSCIWSSDSNWFAWSCGHKEVKVCPWDRTKNCIAESTSCIGQTDGTHIKTGDLVWSMAFGTKSGSRRTEQGIGSHRRSSVCQNISEGDVVLATGLQNGRIRVWDIKTGQLKFELCDDELKQIEGVSFVPDGSLLLASASSNGKLSVWDLEDGGNLVKTLKALRGGFNDCLWSPDSRKIATVGDFKSVCLWDMKTYEVIHRLEGHHHTVCKCDFSPDGALLATCSFDTRVILWDVDTGVQLLELHHCQPPLLLMFAGGANGMHVRSLSFSPDGLYLTTVCDDGFMRMWDLSHPEVPVKVARARNALTCQYSPTGTAVAVGSSKGGVSLWRAPSTVSSLQHLSRLTLRRCLPSSSDISTKLLEIPPALRRYLTYRQNWIRYIE